MLDQVPAFAISREKPLPSLDGIENATQPQDSHEASNHHARERDVEGPDFASFRFRDVEDARSEIDMLDPRAFQGVRPASREQQEPMEFAANGRAPGVADQGRQLIQAKRGVPPLLGVPVDRRDRVLGGQRTRSLARANYLRRWDH